MGEGNGFRPVHCKGRRLPRLRRRSRVCVSVAVREQMEISVCSICSNRPCLWMRQSHKSHKCQFTFVTFVPFLGSAPSFCMPCRAYCVYLHPSPISLTTLLWPESSSLRSSESSPRSASASYLSVVGQMASAMVGTGCCTPYVLILPSSGPTPSLRIA